MSYSAYRLCAGGPKNNYNLCKAHIVSIRAESEAPTVAMVERMVSGCLKVASESVKRLGQVLIRGVNCSTF